MLGLSLAGCNDDPVRPGPVHYNVYIAALDWVDGVATDPLYIIDADSMVVIDSIPQIGSLYDMEVSPDGRFLYNGVHRGVGSGIDFDSVRCIDIKRKKIVWSVPSSTFLGLTLLDEGRIILRRWRARGGPASITDLLDANNGEVIKTLPGSIRYDEGPVSGTKVSGLIGEYPDIRVVGVDVLSGEVWGEFRPRYPGGQPLPTAFTRLHPDGGRVLVMGGVNVGVSYAIVGSLNTGEDIVRGRIYSPAGEGAFSSDGRLAVTSDLNGSLAVFDLDSSIHLGTISAPASQVSFVGAEPSVVTAMYPDYMRGTHPLARVDIVTLEITQFVYLPLPEPLLGAMAVGPRP
ncbi:MAG: hypothetical protein AB1752_13715 [Candidatus Zixiibacteriota bacterium]